MGCEYPKYPQPITFQNNIANHHEHKESGRLRRRGVRHRGHGVRHRGHTPARRMFALAAGISALAGWGEK